MGFNDSMMTLLTPLAGTQLARAFRVFRGRNLGGIVLKIHKWYQQLDKCPLHTWKEFLKHCIGVLHQGQNMEAHSLILFVDSIQVYQCWSSTMSIHAQSIKFIFHTSALESGVLLHAQFTLTAWIHAVFYG